MDTEFIDEGSRDCDPHRAKYPHDARIPVTIDGATGQVIEPDYSRVHVTDGLGNKSTIGFDPTRKLLEVEPFRLSPWLTPELCEEELARGKHHTHE